jgi:hypothetical protein
MDNVEKITSAEIEMRDAVVEQQLRGEDLVRVPDGLKP